MSAALRLLARDGYARMSMDAIAAEAKVSKPTLYLRWEGKLELSVAAVAQLPVDMPSLTGDLRTDLIVRLRHQGDTTAAASPMALTGACLVEEVRHPELLAALRDRLFVAQHELFSEAVIAARDRGELPDHLDQAVIRPVVDLLYGAPLVRYLTGDPLDSGWEESTVDAALRALEAPG